MFDIMFTDVSEVAKALQENADDESKSESKDDDEDMALD
jgi:hypothetical protein